MAKNQEDGSTILLRLEGYVVANHIMGSTRVSQPPYDAYVIGHGVLHWRAICHLDRK
jgi:hypothetical protein